MADVWIAVPFDGVARGPSPPRVAIKTLLPELVPQPLYRERFAREASLHVTLDHPNIVRALDAGGEEGIPYLALEYVDGVTLREIIDALAPERVPPRVALELFSSACAALGCLHEHHGAGLVHCDVSAENLMVGVDGSVKLIDFGLATPTRESAFAPRPALLTETSTIARRETGPFDRIQCVAPERIDGTGLDRRSDVYSVGVILFELIHGARPFDAHELDALLDQIRRGVTVAHGASVDPEVTALIARAMAVDPAARPQTAADLKAAIDASCERLPAAISARDLVDVLVRRALEPGAGDAAAGSVPPPRSSTIRLARKPREMSTPCPEKGSARYEELQRLLDATRESPPAPTPISVLAQVTAESEVPPPPAPPVRDVFQRPPRAADTSHDVFRGYSRLAPPPRHVPAHDAGPGAFAMASSAPAAPRVTGAQSEAAACFERGWQALRQHDLSGALEALEAALALDPGNRTYAVDIRQLRKQLGK